MGHRNGSAKTGARWLIVVQRSQQDLFEVLRQRLEGSDVRVLFDRRVHERRRGSAGQGVERRDRDRRRQRPVAWTVAVETVLAEADLAPTSSGAAADGQDEPSLPTCPTCATPLQIEMPRFPQPPARLDVAVAHVPANGHGPEHYVEIAAFTVTGRLLLSQRVPARARLS
jgi:hypothetical protein